MIMRRRVLVVGSCIAFLGAAYFAHLFRCRTLDDRSDVILLGRMVKMDAHNSDVFVAPVVVYKGTLRGGSLMPIRVRRVARWHMPDVLPPWPAFESDRTAVFYLEESLLSRAYDPLWISEAYRQ